MENFPWAWLARIRLPTGQKPMADLDRVRPCDPAALRSMLGDGNYGGHYQRADAEMKAIWKVAVEETRAMPKRTWF